MPRFDPDRTKVNVKMAVNRLKMMQQRKTALVKTQRREIATLLENGKEESARIKVENVIREDYTIEAYEILELFCELLTARFGLITNSSHCDDAVREAVETIIWAAPRCEEIKEFWEIRNQFILKYGKKFGEDAMENRGEFVNDRIIHKLSISTPSLALVNQYLAEIARAHGIEFDAEENVDGGVVALYPGVGGSGGANNDLLGLLGLSGPTAGGPSGSGGGGSGKAPVSVFDMPLPYSDVPLVPVPNNGGGSSSSGGTVQMTAEQMKLFEQFQAFQAQQQLFAQMQAASGNATPAPSPSTTSSYSTTNNVAGDSPYGAPRPSASSASTPYGAPSSNYIGPSGIELAPGYRLMAGGIVPDPTDGGGPPPPSSIRAQTTVAPRDLPPSFDESVDAEPAFTGLPPLPTNNASMGTAPSTLPPGSGDGGEEGPDFDELANRFAALKRKR